MQSKPKAKKGNAIQAYHREGKYNPNPQQRRAMQLKPTAKKGNAIQSHRYEWQ
jgi:hypothetical protein